MRYLQREFTDDFDLDKFLNMKSFRQKILYANEKLKRISSGSGRIVYEIDDKTVLKLAKNKKGIAQNEVEADYVLNDWYSDIVTGVIESDKDDRWIVSNRAKKINKNKFKQLLGVSMEIFNKYLYGRHNGYTPDIERDVRKYLDDNEFIISLLEMIANFSMKIGDFDRINSYGEIDGKLVISDYGLNKAVWKDYYEER